MQRLPPLVALILILAMGISPSAAQGKSTDTARKHHPWGAFEPGAWKKVRVTQQKLDERGQVTDVTITETRSTLVKVEQNGVTLEIERSIDVGGGHIRGQTRTVRQGFDGQDLGQAWQVTDAGPSPVTIEGKEIPCKIVRLKTDGPTTKTTTDIYYSSTVFPYALRRKSTATALEGDMVLSETTVRVIHLDMPCKVLAEIKSSVDLETVHKELKGTIRTSSTTAASVPGGIVRYRSREFDQNGKLISRSTLELVDYGLESDLERTGLLRRRRPIFSRGSLDRQ